jgi:hypothetical protein
MCGVRGTRNKDDEKYLQVRLYIELTYFPHFEKGVFFREIYTRAIKHPSQKFES